MRHTVMGFRLFGGRILIIIAARKARQRSGAISGEAQGSPLFIGPSLPSRCLDELFFPLLRRRPENLHLNELTLKGQQGMRWSGISTQSPSH